MSGEKSWYDETLDKLAGALKARHEKRGASERDARRDFEEQVALGNRARQFLVSELWTKDLSAFLATREQAAAVPEYRPGENMDVREDWESRRAYASGIKQMRLSMESELARWVQDGERAAMQLKLLRDAEAPQSPKAGASVW